MARDIFTGEMILFNNITEASKHTNINTNAIGSIVNYEKPQPIGGYDFRYNTPNINWPVHSEKDLKIYRRFPRHPCDGVTIFNDLHIEIDFVESVTLTAEKYNTSVSTIYRSDKYGKQFNGYFFSIYKLKNNNGSFIE